MNARGGWRSAACGEGQPGPSGEPSDLVLRQTADPSRGFAWKGQEDYDRVAVACAAYCKSRLEVHCRLAPVAMGEATTFFKWHEKVREIVGHGGKRSLMDGAAAHIACATCSAGRFESLERAHVHAAAAQGLGAGAEA